MCAADWANVIAQYLMFAAQVAAAVFTFGLWNEARRARYATTHPEDGAQLANAVPEATNLPRSGELEPKNVEELIELVRMANSNRSEVFDQHPRTVDRLAAKSMAMVLVPTLALSLITALLSGLLFPSFVAFVTVAVVVLSGLSSMFIWHRLFSKMSGQASTKMWAEVDRTEIELERRLEDAIHSGDFILGSALALHDGLLRTMPRVMPPLILLADRVMIAELVRRLKLLSSGTRPCIPNVGG